MTVLFGTPVGGEVLAGGLEGAVAGSGVAVVRGLVGYARVSTVHQDTRQQVDALLGVGCVRVFVEEAVSGSVTRRPVLDECLETLVPGETLVVWSLDRLGRSTGHLLSVVEGLARRGVSFRSLKERIDAGEVTGQLLLTILAGLAQFERARTIERINAALDAKRRRGEKLGGRPVKLTDEQIAAARKLLAGGERPRAVARMFGVDRTTLGRTLRRTVSDGPER